MVFNKIMDRQKLRFIKLKLICSLRSRRPKMKIIFLSLLIISFIRDFVSSSKEYSTVLDKTLQQFREDILSLQHESYLQLDIAFFTFYNKAFTEVNQTITRSHHLLTQKFRQSCTEFPWYNLEPYAARRLINICDEVQRFLRKIVSFPDNFIEKVYPNPQSLSSETFIELMTEEYFTNMEKHLEFVVPIYHQNRECVIPLFETFLNIYKQPIGAMTKLFEQRMLAIFARTVGRNLRAAEEGARSLFFISEQIKSCSDELVIDTYECISSFVGYDCLKRRTGCGPAYMSMVRTRFYLKRIEKFHALHELVLDEIVEVIKVTDAQLLKWSNKLDKCLNSLNKTSS